jgi:nucleoside phosphorylase
VSKLSDWIDEFWADAAPLQPWRRDLIAACFSDSDSAAIAAAAQDEEASP